MRQSNIHLELTAGSSLVRCSDCLHVVGTAMPPVPSSGENPPASRFLTVTLTENAHSPSCPSRERAPLDVSLNAFAADSAFTFPFPSPLPPSGDRCRDYTGYPSALTGLEPSRKSILGTEFPFPYAPERPRSPKEAAAKKRPPQGPPESPTAPTRVGEEIQEEVSGLPQLRGPPGRDAENPRPEAEVSETSSRTPNNVAAEPTTGGTPIRPSPPSGDEEADEDRADAIAQGAERAWEAFALSHKMRRGSARGVGLEDFLLRASARWRYPALLRAILADLSFDHLVLKFDPSPEWRKEVRRLADIDGKERL